MKIVLIAVVASAVLAACQPVDQLADYRPVVDPGRTDAAKFESDLTACRNIATQVEKQYKDQQAKEVIGGLIAGAIVGAATGAALGHNSGNQGTYVRTGVAAGAIGGAASGDTDYDLVKFGPRRVVDRCMAERGHAILSDLGRG